MTPALKSFLVGYALGIVVGIGIAVFWAAYRRLGLHLRERDLRQLDALESPTVSQPTSHAAVRTGGGVVEEDDPAWYSPEPDSSVVAVEPKHIPVMRHRAQEEEKRARGL